MLLIDSPLGHYQLLHQIGSGGTGTMYLARDSRTSLQVALKVVRLDDTSQTGSTIPSRLEQLFTQEMQTLTQLDHPSLLPVLDSGWENVSGASYAYIAMQYCPAGSLADWLQQEQGSDRLSLAEISRVLTQAAEALHHAHERGVVHQDVKPSNLLLSAPAARSTALPDLLVADFRCASFFTSLSSGGLSQSDYVRTASFYMPPEQWSRKVVPASDQYALAILAFYLLTSQFPFQGSLGQIYSQHCTTPPPAPSSLNAHLSPLVDGIILRALEKEPEKRYPSILAFAQAFAKLPHVASDQQSALLSSPSGISTTAHTTTPSSTSPSLQHLTAASGSFNLATTRPPTTHPGPPLLPLPLPNTFKRRASRLWIRLAAVLLILALVLAGGLAIILHLPKTRVALAPTPGHPTAVIPLPTSTPTAVPTPSLRLTPTFTPAPSSIQTPTPAVVHTTLVDNLKDMSKLYSYTSNLGLDPNNSQWMHGDTSLLVRGANTYGNAVWKFLGMNSFLAVVYFWPPQSSSPLSDLAVSVSTDGVHWTATTPSVGDGSGGENSWIRYTYTLTHLSHVNFVKISWITTATEFWAEQVGQVTLSS